MGTRLAPAHALARQGAARPNHPAADPEASLVTDHSRDGRLLARTACRGRCGHPCRPAQRRDRQHHVRVTGAHPPHDRHHACVCESGAGPWSGFLSGLPSGCRRPFRGPAHYPPREPPPDRQLPCRGLGHHGRPPCRDHGHRSDQRRLRPGRARCHRCCGRHCRLRRGVHARRCRHRSVRHCHRCDHHDCCRRRLHRDTKDIPVKARAGRQIQYDHGKVLNLLKQGLSQTIISERLGISRAQVYRICKRTYGVGPSELAAHLARMEWKAAA